MASNNELAEAYSNARLAVALQIAKTAPLTPSGAELVCLAEAVAWLASPSQPHGGGSAPKAS